MELEPNKILIKALYAVATNRVKPTNVYENRYGRFRVTNNTNDSGGNWQVDWWNGKDIETYPQSSGDSFPPKPAAIQWIKSLAPTKILHERDMPSDGTWTDESKHYETHQEFPAKD